MLTGAVIARPKGVPILVAGAPERCQWLAMFRVDSLALADPDARALGPGDPVQCVPAVLAYVELIQE